VNGDNSVSIADIIILNKAMVGQAVLSGVQMVNANVYRPFSTEVDVMDTLTLMRYTVNTITSLPVV
jgi:hypothetical protein